MTKNPKRLAVVGLIILLGILISWQLSRPKAVEITVEAVDRGTVEATVANTRAGTISACRRAGLTPAIGGQIAHLPVKEGDAVKAGQLLLSL